jgi:hypothetical protein
VSPALAVFIEFLIAFGVSLLTFIVAALADPEIINANVKVRIIK